MISFLIKLGILLIGGPLFIVLIYRLAAPEQRQLALYYQDDTRKPPASTFRKTYGILRLDKADVEHIIRLFQRGSRYDLTLYLDRYQIRDVADIIKIPNARTEYLHIISRLPAATLILSKEKAELEIVDGEDTVLLDVAREIDSLLLQRTTVPRPLPIKPRYIFVFGIVAVLITIDFFPFAGMIRSFLNHHTWIGIAFSVLFAADAALLYYLLFHDYYAKRRHTTIMLGALPSSVAVFLAKYQIPIITAILGILSAIILALLHIGK
jgi:hypothetical protein